MFTSFPLTSDRYVSDQGTLLKKRKATLRLKTSLSELKGRKDRLFCSSTLIPAPSVDMIPGRRRATLQPRGNEGGDGMKFDVLNTVKVKAKMPASNISLKVDAAFLQTSSYLRKASTGSSKSIMGYSVTCSRTRSL